MKKTMHLLGGTLLCLSTTELFAAQLSFSQKNRILEYQWTATDQSTHQLSADFSQTQFALTTFRRYSPQLMEQALQQQAMQWFLQQNINGLQLRRERVGLNYELQLTGNDPQQVRKTSQALKKQQQEAYQQYLIEHHFMLFKDFSNQWSLKPNHVAIAQLSQNDVAPLVAAFTTLLADKSEAEGIALVLSFIQSIPYSALGSDGQQRGTGFSPPAQLLLNNQGDCDSKVTLMASLLLQLYPERKLVMIIVPGHALIGIDLPAQAKQQTLTIQGVNYVLAEPTGPAPLAIGHLDSNTTKAIAQQQVRVEPFSAITTDQTENQ